MPLRSTTALVTGATDGIGLEAARQLAALGARVLVHGRNERTASEAAQDVAKHGGAEPVWGDFGELAEVRELAAQVLSATETLDILVNNAGVFECERRVTTDGHEATFQVNHLAPFLLTNLLLDAVGRARAGRVITLTSVAHFRGEIDLEDLDRRESYDGHEAYAASKLANVLFTQHLAGRLMSVPPTANALHPGTVATKLLERGFPAASGSPVSTGAEGVTYLATAPEVATVTGAYFVGRRQAHPSPKTEAEELRVALWEVSARMVGL